MQISIPIEKFIPDNILFCPRADNTVINGGGFYRVMYCTSDVSMLGVHISFEVDIQIDLENPRFDIREALSKITPIILNIVTELTTTIHEKWEAVYGIKASSYPVTPHSVEPAILKALLQARNSSSQQSVIKMPFVFKCAGVYDTDTNVGVSFRLNSVTRL